MTNFIAAIIALFMWLTSLTTTIPNLKDVNTNDIDLKNFVTVSDVREVPEDELYAFYQENFKHMKGEGADADIYNHPENYPELPDLTEEYQALLDENLKIAQEWKTVPGLGQIEFYNAVKDHGVWDYKRPANHPDWETYNGKFIVYGVVMDFEILGNVNFAFTGAALGFTPVTICTGGGFVDVKNTGGDWNDLPYYFDNEDDNAWITFGIELYALMDSVYVEQSYAIDCFFDLADPRAALIVLKLYKDM